MQASFYIIVHKCIFMNSFHLWFSRMRIPCAHGSHDCPGYPGQSALVPSLTSALSTKQQFWENTLYDMSTKILFCQHNNDLFWKRKDIWKKTNEIAFKKTWLFAKSTLLSECILDAQPATVYPASPNDLSRNSKIGFWSEHHCIYFLTIVLSTIVAVGMTFAPTCRQRNLSSTTALVCTIIRET